MSRKANLESGEDGEPPGGHEGAVPGVAGLPRASPRQPRKLAWRFFFFPQVLAAHFWKESCVSMRVSAQVMSSYFRRADPFFDEQENHSLIGVANVFLSCLFYDVKLQYAVPIINQKGEVSGHRPGRQPLY